MAGSGTRVAAPPPELGEWVLRDSLECPKSDDKVLLHELNQTLTAIKLGAKVVNGLLAKAGSYGANEATGVSAGGPPRCDIVHEAESMFQAALANRHVVAGIATPRSEGPVPVAGCEDRRLVALIDPLDGSSQADVNVSVGTIFSLFARVSPLGSPVEARDFLQPGSAIVCAGYVIYGTSTLIVLTMGRGVCGFTVDPGLGSFYMSHSDIRLPVDGKIYSVNTGLRDRFPAGVCTFIDWCQEKAFSLRFIGSLVADFHRNMLRGGIYIYPPTWTHPKPKISLPFQCAPLAFIAEQAGGRASDGKERILDKRAQGFDDRVPFFCGSANLVAKIEAHMREAAPAPESKSP